MGASVHLAPSGRPGRLIGHGWSESTDMEKAIRVPSGDHSTLPGLFCRWVTCVSAPSASIQRTKIWVPSSSAPRVKRMRSPLGDHSGDEPSVKRRFRVPSAFMIHTSESRWSLILSTQLRV